MNPNMDLSVTGHPGKDTESLSGRGRSPMNRHLLKMPLRRHLTPSHSKASDTSQPGSALIKSDSNIMNSSRKEQVEGGFTKASSPFFSANRRSLPKNEKSLLPTVLLAMVCSFQQKKFHRNKLANGSNLIFEMKLKRTSEQTKLFDYLERKETIKFLAVAKSSNLELSQLRSKKGRSLMHVAAMVGDEQIARYLRDIHCLGNFKDVRFSHKDEGLTAKDLAIKYCNEHIADIIRR